MYKSDFGMFSQEGDLAVGNLIDNARTYNWTWSMCLRQIDAISRNCPNIAEISDTAVREVIYDILGFETDFYLDKA